jgi:hypothetical protein
MAETQARRAIRETVEITRSLSEPCRRCGHAKAFHRVGMVEGQYRERTPCQHRDCECRAWVSEQKGEE